MRFVKVPGYQDTWINPEQVVSVERYGLNAPRSIDSVIRMSDGKWVVITGMSSETVLRELLNLPD